MYVYVCEVRDPRQKEIRVLTWETAAFSNAPAAAAAAVSSLPFMLPQSGDEVMIIRTRRVQLVFSF